MHIPRELTKSEQSGRYKKIETKNTSQTDIESIEELI